ncbi:MAG: hypothetical protein ACP5OC_00265 [Thermoplasmata archaeon]
MKKKTLVIGSMLVALIVIISSFSIFYFDYERKVDKTISFSFNSDSVNYSVPVYNNCSGTMFTISFNITGFPGGTIDLQPNFVLCSRMTPANYSLNASLSNNSYYGITFTASSLFVKSNQTSGEQYGWLVENNTRFSARGPSIEWNNSGIWSPSAGSLVLPPGNFKVTEKVFFISLQPSQSVLNVKYARAWVKVLSMDINAIIRTGTDFTISDISLS